MSTLSSRAQIDASRLARPNMTARETAATQKTTGQATWKGWEELWREIYTPLLLQPKTGRPQVLAVSSAADGEGKTTLSLALGLSMAEDLEKSVLVLDCNLFRPTLSECLGLGDVTGMRNCLAREASLQSVTQQSRLPNLWFVPAGTRAENPSRLVRSSVMADLMQEARSKYDVVIMDTPSLLAASDARIIASHADSLLLVVRAGVSATTSVSKALGLVQGVANRGMVVNDFRSSLPRLLRRWVLTT